MATYILRPNNDIDVELTRNTGSYNFQNVDEETADDDTTYNYYTRDDESPETTKTDEYDLEQNNTVSGVINHVKVKARVGKETITGDTDESSVSIRLGLAFSDGVVWSAGISVTSEGYSDIEATFTETATGNPITIDDMNNAYILIDLYPYYESQNDPYLPPPEVQLPPDEGVPS